MGDLLKGKRGLVMGVANDHSIAWGIARAVAAEGAELAAKLKEATGTVPSEEGDVAATPAPSETP